MITTEQANQIRMYRLNGHSYASIARLTDLPESTVRSYCYRTPELKAEAKPITKPVKDRALLCAQCGAPLPESKFRPRRFCSDKCRSRYWSINAPYAVGRQAMVQCTCQHCGKRFMDYAKRGRKYCSQACYLADRYGGQKDDQ